MISLNTNRTLLGWSHLHTILKKYTFVIITISVFLLFLYSVAIRIQAYDSTANVQNIDASYHVLLTSLALDQNTKESWLLPLVTLSDDTDKHIPWGATIPDKAGNYYYTSFPQLGFIFPFFIFNTFNIENNIFNLMILNMIIEFISLVLLFILLYRLAKDATKSSSIASIATGASMALYILNIEVLYSQGVIYWAQSLMQPILLSQILITYFIIQNKSFHPLLAILLFIVSAIGVATEWTGYVSAIGIIILFSFRAFTKLSRNKYIKYSLFPLAGMLTGALLFIIPFILKTSPELFTNAIISRFTKRSAASPVDLSWYEFIKSYIESFGVIIATCLILIVLLYTYKRDWILFIINIKKYIWLIFISSFPILENIIMKQHAFEYSFDRLKFIIPILIFITIISMSIRTKSLAYAVTALFSISLMCSIVIFYNNDRVSTIPQHKNTMNITSYLKNNYPNASYSFSGPVRGWLNVTYEKNIREQILTYGSFTMNCNNPTCVWILGETISNTMYVINGALIYDKNNKTISIIESTFRPQKNSKYLSPIYDLKLHEEFEVNNNLHLKQYTMPI